MERKFQSGPDLGRSDPSCVEDTDGFEVILFLAGSDSCVTKDGYRSRGSLLLIRLEVA